ncbi:MAG: sensor histidine kinase [Chitinophagaceae bacterium]
MIKDLILKSIFIPLLGIGLPLISGLVHYNRYSVFQIIAANLFFIFTSFVIWKGCNWIHGKLRPLYRPISNPFSKIVAVCFVSAMYGACTGGLSALVWLKISGEPFNRNGIYIFIAACVAAVILFTLVYEILYLSKERELDTKIVDQLDRELSQAELHVLTNEMDPHFLFNSLNTLNYLILNDPHQAHRFNNRLAQVYKYFLINKNKDLISLKDELEFIENYFFLLQIRHDNKLQLHSTLNDKSYSVMIPPCSLQILVENAIKHNEFSDTNPLLINVTINDHYLQVSNNANPKLYGVNSTGIGLKNLSSRYKLLFRKDITIASTKDSFIVKLPLINNP